MKPVLGVFALTLARLAHAQDVLTVLGEQDGISQFTDILSQYTDLVDYLNTGVHTLLVPTDSAIAQAKSSMPDVFADNSNTRTLVEYHILKDTHPSATFSNTSQLVPTLLTNTSCTNVTGGQRVELLERDGQPIFRSAVQAESKISHGDVLYVGGLVHIVDSVLQIPLSFPSTIPKRTSQTCIAYKLAVETPDLTILVPNNENYGADFTGWDGLSQDQLDQIFVYHVLREVVYTTSMKNGSQFPTMANLTVTARTYGGGTNESAVFLNNALLTGSNYITSNGVFQVIDRPLDPTDSTAAPSTTDVNDALGLPVRAPSKGITTAAVVGIVIGILAVLVTLGLAFALRARMRKRRAQTEPTRGGAISSSSYRQMPPDYHEAMGDSRRLTQRTSIHPARTNAPLPARPDSVARSIASIRGALWQSRPPQNNVVELDAKDYHVHVNELGSEESNSAQNRSTNDSSTAGARSYTGDAPARPPRTPPELDSIQRSRRQSQGARSHVSITFHGETPRHIGFQAQY
ncbi:hypothetical protein LTR70_007886 [Exophiala xenobiotica]|uniref:FAS1 domain-containing protein n=1 Tax=Lithohypha guttulata TaxID=1690604 RepID=A0ABR0K3M9_9EURO|nr:hypothetical protein LTR24_007558 [Lithohypha guttulata]KAK5312969.1 hypothetical protein LTR70_007886 [Exophiala xenobiotica]